MSVYLKRRLWLARFSLSIFGLTRSAPEAPSLSGPSPGGWRGRTRHSRRPTPRTTEDSITLTSAHSRVLRSGSSLRMATNISRSPGVIVVDVGLGGEDLGVVVGVHLEGKDLGTRPLGDPVDGGWVGVQTLGEIGPGISRLCNRILHKQPISPMGLGSGFPVENSTEGSLRKSA